MRDTAAILDVTAGPDTGAPYFSPPAAGGFVAAIGKTPRRLRIGFSRAARLIDMMEADGVVSPAAGGKREVLVDQGYFEEVDAQLR